MGQHSVNVFLSMFKRQLSSPLLQQIYVVKAKFADYSATFKYWYCTGVSFYSENTEDCLLETFVITIKWWHHQCTWWWRYAQGLWRRGDQVCRQRKTTVCVTELWGGYSWNAPGGMQKVRNSSLVEIGTLSGRLMLSSTVSPSQHSLCSSHSHTSCYLETA